MERFFVSQSNAKMFPRSLGAMGSNGRLMADELEAENIFIEIFFLAQVLAAIRWCSEPDENSDRNLKMKHRNFFLDYFCYFLSSKNSRQKNSTFHFDILIRILVGYL